MYINFTNFVATQFDELCQRKYTFNTASINTHITDTIMRYTLITSYINGIDCDKVLSI